MSEKIEQLIEQWLQNSLSSSVDKPGMYVCSDYNRLSENEKTQFDENINKMRLKILKFLNFEPWK